MSDYISREAAIAVAEDRRRSCAHLACGAEDSRLIRNNIIYGRNS